MYVTKVVIICHEGHSGNVLPEDARQRAMLSGKRLAEMGLKADVAVSSPQACALETLLCNLTGMGSIPPIRTDDSFDGTLPGTPTCHESVLEAMKAEANNAGMTIEEYLLGEEKGWALHVEVLKHPGETIMLCSHGGTTIEPMIRSLDRHHIDQGTDQVFQEGASALLTFGNDPSRSLLNVEYFGNLGKVPDVSDPGPMPYNRGV